MVSFVILLCLVLSGCANTQQRSDPDDLASLTGEQAIYAALKTDPAEQLVETIRLEQEHIGVIVNEAAGYIYFVMMEQAGDAARYRKHSGKLGVGDPGAVQARFQIDEHGREIPFCFARKGKAVDVEEYSHQIPLEDYELYYTPPALYLDISE